VSGSAPRVGTAAARSLAPATSSQTPLTANRASVQAANTVREKTIVSPNPDVRWRIVFGRVVQRSGDSGSTWQNQETGVAATIAAGSSPSSSICWLVGSGGTVLLSTDGRTWRRVAFPDLSDLASVYAVDANVATVTALDGRSFSTTDGGSTWTR
jgi:photosystem II stability/assembly factor-like uncharacterized protein